MAGRRSVKDRFPRPAIGSAYGPRQLSHVLAVADVGSFTEAAPSLHVAQPSLSQQIRALEKELGRRLLERPPGRYALRPPGARSSPRRALP